MHVTNTGKVVGWQGALTIETKVPKGWLPTRTAAHRSRPKTLVAHGRISLRALALFKVFRSTAMASSFRELTRSCLLTIRRSIVAHAFLSMVSHATPWEQRVPMMGTLTGDQPFRASTRRHRGRRFASCSQRRTGHSMSSSRFLCWRVDLRTDLSACMRLQPPHIFLFCRRRRLVKRESYSKRIRQASSRM